MITYEHVPPSSFEKIPLAGDMLREEERVIFAYLFGSAAQGRISPLSDIDIAVYLRTCEHLTEYRLELFNKLCDVLGTSEIDLVFLNTAPTNLEGRILMKKKILVDKDPHLRHRYESLAMRKFYDFQIRERAILYRRYAIGR